MESKLIWLMIGPGTLTSQGTDRMDTLRYAEWRSGRPRLNGHELLAAVPEVAGVAKGRGRRRKSLSDRQRQRPAYTPAADGVGCPSPRDRRHRIRAGNQQHR